MSNRTLKILATIVIVTIIFSAFNTFLIFDSLHVQEQLKVQDEKLAEIQIALDLLSAQEEQLDMLQSEIDQLNTQGERINELQNVLDQIITPEDQILELQNTVDEVRNNIGAATSDLSILADQVKSLNQSTSTNLAEIETTIENLEDLLSELSNLEEIINQLHNWTPAEVYDVTYRSVVVIRTPVGQGSGFLFNSSNLIATNYHVVEDETDIEIEFFDRTRTQATVIGSDAYSDVAVLSISSAPIGAAPLDFGDQANIGQQVVAIGNPLGLTESLSVGYISQVNRTLDIEPIIVPILQLDLTIAPGSSGGPLLDLSGNVVGITNAGTEVGFNFAVPVNILNRVIPSLVEEGTYDHPFIGVSPLALTPEVVAQLNILNVDSYQTGLLVLSIVPNYPADQAGLEPAISGTQSVTAKDIILAVDGNPTFIEEDLTAYMEVEVSPNQVIILTLWRSGVTTSVNVTTTVRPPHQG
jgi:S1-C subfamily serine protease